MYQFIENLKSDKAFYFYNGTTALYALLKSMDIGRDDEVILQVFTCPAVPSPVVRLGATPVYVDIDPTTFNIDSDKIESRITNKTKVIIVQHTFGIPAEMESILDLARKYDLWVIEDACHALGSKYSGREVGTLADAAIYSFGWHKPVVIGKGGAAIVNNAVLKQRMEETCNHFVIPLLRELLILHLYYLAYALLFRPSRFWFMREIYRRLSGFKQGPHKGKIGPLLFRHSSHVPSRSIQNSRSNFDTLEEPLKLPKQNLLTVTSRSENEKSKKIIPFQKKRLFKKLNYWTDMVAYQRWIVSRYEDLLSQADYEPLTLEHHLEPVYYKYPLLSDRKKEILEKAQKERLEMSDMFMSPLHSAGQAETWKALGYQEGMCPISENISNRIIALPVHATVDTNTIEKTMIILEFFNKQPAIK
jgi:dTDP-4-amino-4,6-dideoxygalactose transaminase